MISMSNFDSSRLDLDDLIRKATEGKQNGTFDSKEGVERFISENLPAAQAEKLRGVLSDEQKTRAILESREAQELLKKLSGGR